MTHTYLLMENALTWFTLGPRCCIIVMRDVGESLGYEQQTDLIEISFNPDLLTKQLHQQNFINLICGSWNVSPGIPKEHYLHAGLQFVLLALYSNQAGWKWGAAAYTGPMLSPFMPISYTGSPCIRGKLLRMTYFCLELALLCRFGTSR